MVKIKKCSRCLEHKSLDSFYNCKIGKYRKQSQCKKCRTITMREYRKTKPDITKKHDKKKYNKRKDYYLTKSNQRYNEKAEYIKQQKKEYRLKNKDRLSQLQKEHYIKNKPKYQESAKRFREKNKERLKNQRYIQTYGISLIDFNRMKEIQNNVCAICNKEDKLVVDHCHKTGKIRQLLCPKCNKGIGLFYENIDILTSAINYVRKHY